MPRNNPLVPVHTFKLLFAVLWVSSLSVIAQGQSADVPKTENRTIRFPLNVSQASTIEATKSPHLWVKLSKIDHPILVPIRLDTTLLNNGGTPNAAAGIIQVRDNRFHQGLFLANLNALKEAPTQTVEWAEFHFFTSYAEKQEALSFRFHRMKKPWTEAATWFNNGQSDPIEWQGIRPGTDYDFRSFAETSFDTYRPGATVIRGFGPQVSKWLKTKAVNNGFVMQLSGRALQVNTVSTNQTEALANPFLVSRGDSLSLKLSIDLNLLRKVFLKPDDLQQARLTFRLLRKPSGKKRKPRSRQTTPFDIEVTETQLTLTHFSDTIRTKLTGTDPVAELTVHLPADEPLVLYSTHHPEASFRPQFELNLPDYEHHLLFTHKPVPRDGIYTTVKEGHLYYGDERLRIWGTLGSGDAGRIRRMGFNGWRLWPTASEAYDEDSASTGEFPPVIQGDNSAVDLLDQKLAEVRSHDLFVMATQLMGMMPVEYLTRDNSFVSEGKDWSAWKSALLETSLKNAPFHFAMVDERLLQARLKHIENILNHPEPLYRPPVGRGSMHRDLGAQQRARFCTRHAGGKVSRLAGLF